MHLVALWSPDLRLVEWGATVQDNDFEWDDWKAAENIAKHNVSFEQASDAFNDPGNIEQEDPDPDEERYVRTCMSGRDILVIVYTERGNRIRIISARRATRHEQQTYFRRRP